MKTKKIIAAVIVLFLIAMPAFAVFNEKDLSNTLSVLKFELKQEYTKATSQNRMKNRKEMQHIKLVSLLKKCNELSLILYSQGQDCTFDMTYALKTVTDEYESFSKDKRPFDDIVKFLDIEIDRYSRLIESLRRLPPQLSEVNVIPDSLAYHNDSLDRFENSILAASAETADTLCNTYVLDEQGRLDRDSCIFYASELLKKYSQLKDENVSDKAQYVEIDARLKESYDYARQRYELIQRSIFLEGQQNYLSILKKFRLYTSKAFQDAVNKYKGTVDSTSESSITGSEWRGPLVFGFIGLVIIYIILASVLSVLVMMILRKSVKSMQTEEFRKKSFCLNLFIGTAIFTITLILADFYFANNFFIMASKLLVLFGVILSLILLSLLIRIPGDTISANLKVYLPAIIIGFIVIIFRAIFIPNSLINLILPPLLAIFSIWQFILCRKYSKSLPQLDSIVSWISFAIFVTSTLISISGYVLMSIQLLIWWYFQQAAIEFIFSLYCLMEKYYVRSVKPRLENVKQTKAFDSSTGGKGANINITWLYDLLNDAAIPLLAVMTLPICLFQAADVFDLKEIISTMVHKPFFDLTNTEGEQILQLSLYKIVLATSLFFIFKYINYASRSFYHHFKVENYKRKNNLSHVRSNEINFTLANNVIAILVWGAYIALIVVLLKIPMGALSIVAAGLATGIGLALKDVLNNFIYGIQLMSGRLRVGDWVECDGERGTVTAISYQSTQIETLDGAIISYLNAALFEKNFKNLTRNNSYECLKIVVGVGYGTDVEVARDVIVKALSSLQRKDSYGRSIIDAKKGINVYFEEFNSSSVDLAVKQYVLVSQRTAYNAAAKEAIYNALNEAGIEIPFPQCDVFIKNQ